MGNLLTRSARTSTTTASKSPPTIPPSLDSKPWPDNQVAAPNAKDDAREGVELFAKGLRIELSKPLRSCDKSLKGRMKEKQDLASDAEEDDIEGRCFNLERALDLTIGLTDAFRYGLIHTEDAVWRDAALVAERALRHPVINPYAKVEISTAPRAVGQPAVKGRELSFGHPATNVPIESQSPHYAQPELKLRLTIEVHLWYLLALSKWPSDRAGAEACWQKIVNVAGEDGVGTREGNEILAKARDRLRSDVDDSWKYAKRRKNSISSSDASSSKDQIQTTRRKTASNDGAARTQIGTQREGVALALLNQQSPIENGRRQQVPTSFGRPSNQAAKASFHFATAAEDDYPTPPSSASSPSPPHIMHTSDAPPTPIRSAPRRIASSASFYPRGILPRAKSSASLATLPPTWDGLGITHAVEPVAGVVQAQTKASLSSPLTTTTSPTDRGPTWISGSVRQGLQQFKLFTGRFTSKFTLNESKSAAHPRPTAIKALKDIIRRDDESAAPGTYWGHESDVEHLTDEHAQEPSPSSTEAEAWQREPSASVSRPRLVHVKSSGSLRKSSRLSELQHSERPLRKNRSFVDPTSASCGPRSNRTPRVMLTPPTPDKLSIASDSTLAVPKPCRPSSTAIDPVLEELERTSRVGVKTVCATCGKRGLNFPACPRCKETYCSRDCRVTGVSGTGDKHVCRTL